MAKNRYDSKRVFRRKPGGPWYAWLYEIDAHGVRQRTRFSTGQLDKQAAIAVLVDRERAAAQAPHGLPMPKPRPMTFTIETVKRPKPRPMTFTIETAKRPRLRSTPKQAKRRTQ